ncbi:hypothetical protein A7C99_4582 [Trichophyton rubrum]|uniref:Uncharacterized protein n=3 Tax=Trichophyton TaxID=5550 RepID=A0A178EV16_TRIRU|nr:hypothetical protein A7C99_4582 [Trichophyton rubrum]
MERTSLIERGRLLRSPYPAEEGPRGGHQLKPSDISLRSSRPILADMPDDQRASSKPGKSGGAAEDEDDEAVEQAQNGTSEHADVAKAAPS